MEELFCDPYNHFVGKTVKHLQDLVNDSLFKIVEEHIGEIDQVLENFSNNLRGYAPVEYEITPTGAEFRDKLRQALPRFQQRLEELQKLVPAVIEDGKQGSPVTTSTVKASKSGVSFDLSRATKR